jgi:L-seryl-tRNA(Ser) seleniumtransferase
LQLNLEEFNFDSGDSMSENTTGNPLRMLPSVDILLRSETAVLSRDRVGAKRLANLARNVISEMRAELPSHTNELQEGHGQPDLLIRAEILLGQALERDIRSKLARVINATGVILHTNLGRASLSESAIRSVVAAGSNYCALEYDLDTGTRGRRGGHAEDLLSELTGAPAVAVVNNCAAAVFLVLTTLASGGESLISRGELVEIGGDFRVPEVMTASGTHLVEVGTTNRTRLSDYVKAINDRTRLIMRVHPSNYRIVGFTSVPQLSELVELAHNSGVPFFEDAGSGAIIDLGRHGIVDEPIISDSIAAGADVVSFSGDKLLGGPQAGIIVGTVACVERIRRHPLFRALRAGKLVLAALEGTLSSYCRGTEFDDIPTLQKLSATHEMVQLRAVEFVQELKEANSHLQCELITGESVVGGGAAPTTGLPTCEIAIHHPLLSPEDFDEKLRTSSPPVIAKILEGRVRLDLRSVSTDEEPLLLGVLRSI